MTSICRNNMVGVLFTKKKSFFFAFGQYCIQHKHFIAWTFSAVKHVAGLCCVNTILTNNIHLVLMLFVVPFDKHFHAVLIPWNYDVKQQRFPELFFCLLYAFEKVDRYLEFIATNGFFVDPCTTTKCYVE